jgi:hypothetical protein
MQKADLDRVRANEETFARANEEIRQAADRHHVDPVPFMCECSAVNCTALIRVPIVDYERVRAAGGFLVCPDHDDPHVEQVIEDHGSFVIVDKFR